MDFKVRFTPGEDELYNQAYEVSETSGEDLLERKYSKINKKKVFHVLQISLHVFSISMALVAIGLHFVTLKFNITENGNHNSNISITENQTIIPHLETLNDSFVLTETTLNRMIKKTMDIYLNDTPVIIIKQEIIERNVSNIDMDTIQIFVQNQLRNFSSASGRCCAENVTELSPTNCSNNQESDNFTSSENIFNTSDGILQNTSNARHNASDVDIMDYVNQMYETLMVNITQYVMNESRNILMEMERQIDEGKLTAKERNVQLSNNYTSLMAQSRIDTKQLIDDVNKNVSAMAKQYATKIEASGIMAALENAKSEFNLKSSQISSKMKSLEVGSNKKYTDTTTKYDEAFRELSRYKTQTQTAISTLGRTLSRVQDDIDSLNSESRTIKLSVNKLNGQMNTANQLISGKEDRGWVVAGNGYMYHIHPVPQTSWSSAVAKCRELGAELAHVGIRDKYMHAWLFDNLLRFNPLYKWIGLSDIGRENQWKWLDGKVLNADDFSNWAPNQPNNYGTGQDCAVIDSNDSKWNDIECVISRARSVVPLCEQKI